MKKMILCGMFLGLLTGMCLAQRGGARPMGPVGANAGPSPNVGIPSHAVTLPDTRSVAPDAARSGVSKPAKTVGPNVGMNTTEKTADPGAAAGTNAKTVGPTAAAGTTVKNVGPDAEPDSRAPTTDPNATTAPAGPKPQ